MDGYVEAYAALVAELRAELAKLAEENQALRRRMRDMRPKIPPYKSERLSRLAIASSSPSRST